MVVSFCLSQPWFPLIFKILPDVPVLLTFRKHLLHLPQYPQTLHSIWRKVDLLVFHLVGSSKKTAGYLKKQYRSIMEILTRQKYLGRIYKFLQNSLQRNINATQENFKNSYRTLNTVFPKSENGTSVRKDLQY